MLEKGFCEKGGEYSINHNTMERQLDNWLFTEAQDDHQVELRYTMKPEQARLLDTILFQSDYSDLAQFEKTVYQFGSSLCAKDRLGRAIFVCMASLVRTAGCTG